jgi:hypothetical protein
MIPKSRWFRSPWIQLTRLAIGSLSPRHGSFSDCGWTTPPHTEGSCEYTNKPLLTTYNGLSSSFGAGQEAKNTPTQKEMPCYKMLQRASEELITSVVWREWHVCDEMFWYGTCQTLPILYKEASAARSSVRKLQESLQCDYRQIQEDLGLSPIFRRPHQTSNSFHM